MAIIFKPLHLVCSSWAFWNEKIKNHHCLVLLYKFNKLILAPTFFLRGGAIYLAIWLTHSLTHSLTYCLWEKFSLAFWINYHDYQLIPDDSQMVPIDSWMVQNDSQMLPSYSQMVPNDSQMVLNDPKMVPNDSQERYLESFVLISLSDVYHKWGVKRGGTSRTMRVPDWRHGREGHPWYDGWWFFTLRKIPRKFHVYISIRSVSWGVYPNFLISFIFGHVFIR